MRTNLLSHIGARTMACVLLIFLLLPFIGCGGGTPGGKQTAKRGKGTAVFAIKWPERQKSTRLIPTATNWIVISISDSINTGGTGYGTQYLQRPTPPATYVTTATFAELPPGQFYATATAYPSDPRTTTPRPQAANSVPLTIADNQTTTTNLTMGSTITHLVVTEATDGTVTNGGSLTPRLRNKGAVVTVQALDSANMIVLTNAITFANSNPATVNLTQASNTATLSNNNNTLGESNITVQETEAGLTFSFKLKYKAAIVIADSGNKRIVQMEDIAGTGFTSFDTTNFGVSPVGVAMDSANNIYYTAGNNLYRISSITATTATAATLTGTKALNGPTGIFLDAADRIYIADTGNNRVVSMTDLAGANFASFTNVLNVALGTLMGPKAVTVVGGFIYIADTGNNRIVQTDLLSDLALPATAPNVQAYKPVDSGMGGTQAFVTPTSLAYDGTNLVALDQGRNRVRSFPTSVFTSGALPTDYSPFNQSVTPFGIAKEAGTTHFYVTEQGGNAVDRFDGIPGTNLISYGASGSGTAIFSGPSGIFVR